MKLTLSTKIILFLVAIIALLLLAGCGDSNASEPQGETETSVETRLVTKKQRIEGQLVVDISNRMLVPNQVEHDLAVGKALVSFLSERARKGLYFSAGDRLAVDVLPQASTPPAVHDIVEDLVFDVGAIPVQERRTRLPLLAETFERSLRGLLEAASRADKFSGGNVYRQFSEFVRIDSTDNTTRDILILVSDGYFHSDDLRFSRGSTFASMYDLVRPLRNKTNWRELVSERNSRLLVPGNRSFPTLEVLVIGVSPVGGDRYWNEFELVEHFIKEFFSSMNVKRIEVHPAYDSADTIRNVVSRFLENGGVAS